MKSIEILSKHTDGQKNIADTWTTSRRSTSPSPHPGTITLVCNDDDRQAGPMRERRNSKPTTKILTSLRQEQGRHNFFYSEDRENEAKTIRWSVASRIGMDESTLVNLLLTTFLLFIILTTMVATRTSRLSTARTPRHSMARSPMARSPMARAQVMERVTATDSWQILCGSHIARFWCVRRFVSPISRSDISGCRARDGCEDRTPRRTHIFLCLVTVPLMTALSDVHACVWLELKSETWLGRALLKLESGDPPAPLRQEGCCLAAWLNHLFSQVISPRPASTSAVSARRSTTLPSENSDSFHQQSAASGSPQARASKCGKPMA